VNDSFSIASGATLAFSGSLLLAGALTVSGGTLVDNGALAASMATINSNVLGTGTMEFTNIHDGAGWAYLDGSSGAGITYDLTADIESVSMAVEHPDTFHSTVDLGPSSSLDLVGLAATSYDLKNDLLTLYQGNKAVYQLHLTDQPDGTFYVTSGTGGVVVGNWPSVFGPPPVGLPQHTATV
jgi:hypothetical protein